MEKNNNEEEFFDKKEIRSAQKHHFFAKFLIFLLVLIAAFGGVYYFVLNTPKKTYVEAVNKVFKDNNVSLTKEKELNYNYSLELNIDSKNEQYKDIIDIVNKTKISGTTNYDKTNKLLLQNSTIEYKNEKLISTSYMLDLNNNTFYLKANDILDKVIKLDLNDNEEEKTTSYNTDSENYSTVINSIAKAIKETLETANYERKITKLNKEIVFEETLLIDKEFQKQFLTKLLQDEDYLKSMAKIKNEKVSEISDELNEDIDDIKDEKETISIYKTILKNEIIKIECKAEKDSLTITKEDNKYNFEYVEKYALKYKGYIKVDKSDKENKITLNYENVQEEENVYVYLTYSKNTKDISFDKSNAITYDKLTEEDTNKITKYLSENKAFKLLAEDTGLINTIEQYM